MGEPLEAWGERIELLLPFQVNPELMAATGNPRTKFMHCLPAFHNSETKVGAQIAEQYPHLENGVEVTTLRVAGLHRLRTSGKPDAYDQGESSWPR